MRFLRKPCKAYRPDWDHDHCAGCWAKFAEHSSDAEPIEREGYATTADYGKGADYVWICVPCFLLFRSQMGWIEVASSNQTTTNSSLSLTSGPSAHAYGVLTLDVDLVADAHKALNCCRSPITNRRRSVVCFASE